MNITFVTPGMNYGGAERVISILSNQWVTMGHIVNILIVGEDDKCVYTLNEQINVYCIGGLKGKPIISHLNLINKIRKAIKAFDTEVAISFMNDVCAYTALALLNTKIPLIYSERNDPTRVNQRKIDKIYRRIVEKMANGFVFQTNGAKSHYRMSVQKKSTVILNPIDTSNMPVYDFKNRKKEIVSVGRLQPQKNQKLLIDAFALLTNEFNGYKLKIYGEGVLRNELQEQIDGYGLSDRIFLMGAHKDIFDKISSASLFVLSSDFEGLPNTLIEAMCIGIPSVSTNCSPGGAAEIISDGENGIIVPCNDAEALAKAIKEILVDEEKALSFSNEAKKINNQVNLENISIKWIKFIEEHKC